LSATSQVKKLRYKVLESISRSVNYQFKTDTASGLLQIAQEPIAISSICLLMILQITYFNQPLGPILISILLFYRAFGAIMIMQTNLQNTLSYSGYFEIVYDEFTSLNKNHENNGNVQINTLYNSIKFIDVKYSYNKDTQHVLKKINLNFNVNETIAIIGESGSGKSTLADLVTLTLRPDSGSILVDGINSIEIELDSWRRQIGYVSQETVLFDDTIAYNISLETNQVDSNELILSKIINVAKLAGLDDFVKQLPEGYNTIVGERGVRLSGGQRQRLFIARELFRNPKILILDEATSALDSESEFLVQQSIDKLKGKITVIIIAHRLSTIRNVDYVYLMKKGEIIEHGNYKQLRDNQKSKLNSLINFQNL
jgi:subfamily B ATP-binding cassette protein MsbA